MDGQDKDSLFELCKGVYEKTGWKPTDWQHGDEYGQPLYTSDYLLEKLPPTIKDEFDGGDNYLMIWNKCGKWKADYLGTFIGHDLSFDTPLKALLKLTIALSEAGELDNG